MTRARDNADLVHTLIGGTSGQTFKASDSSSTLGSFSTATSLDLPTITSISPSVMLPSTGTEITITGTNFSTQPSVQMVASDGDITAASSITRNSATEIDATFTHATKASYYIRVENKDGTAVRSGSALLAVSDAPAWQTSAGSLGTFSGGAAISVYVAAHTSDSQAIKYYLVSGALPGGLSLNESTGLISGTESGATTNTTYSFTVEASDTDSQTAQRAFTIAIDVGISNSGQFN